MVPLLTLHKELNLNFPFLYPFAFFSTSEDCPCVHFSVTLLLLLPMFFLFCFCGKVSFRNFGISIEASQSTVTDSNFHLKNQQKRIFELPTYIRRNCKKRKHSLHYRALTESLWFLSTRILFIILFGHLWTCTQKPSIHSTESIAPPWTCA